MDTFASMIPSTLLSCCVQYVVLFEIFRSRLPNLFSHSADLSKKMIMIFEDVYGSEKHSYMCSLIEASLQYRPKLVGRPFLFMLISAIFFSSLFFRTLFFTLCLATGDKSHTFPLL